MRFKWCCVLLVALLVALGGCKDNDRPASVPPTSGPPPVVPPRPTPAADCPTLPTQGEGLYVALGDSYSAGEGAPLLRSGCDEWLPGTATARKLPPVGTIGCHRSVNAWAVQVAAQLEPKLALSFHACSGATIEDFFSKQKGAESDQQAWLKLNDRPNPKIKLITFSFGGNDAGFADTLSGCAGPIEQFRPGTIDGDGPCTTAITKAQGLIDHLNLPAGGWAKHRTLTDFYRAVRLMAPDAQVLVVGYPRFFPDKPPKKCGGGGTRNFTRAQMLKINTAARTADDAIRAAASDSEVRFEFVDIYNTFYGHDVCTNKGNWINRVQPKDPNLSFHPTANGQRAIAGRVISCLNSYCGALADEAIVVRDPKFDNKIGQFTFDHVSYYTGQAAVDYCRTNHIDEGDGELCNDYYLANNVVRTQTAQLDPSAKFSIITTHRGYESADGTRRPITVNVDDMRKVVQTDGDHMLLRLTILGGKITAMDEVYTP